MPVTVIGDWGIGSAVGGGGPVVFDANATAPVDSGDLQTTKDLTTLTIGSGTNRALIVQLGWKGIAMTGITVNWDATGTPQACTLITSAAASDNSSTAQLWGLVNPIVGNKTLRVSWTNGTEVIINATSFSGVNQSGGASSFVAATPATGTSTTPSITISSVTGDYTVDCTNVAASSPGELPSQTLLFSIGGLDADNPAASRATGAASNTHSWTIGGSAPWVSVGCNIKAG